MKPHQRQLGGSMPEDSSDRSSKKLAKEGLVEGSSSTVTHVVGAAIIDPSRSSSSAGVGRRVLAAQRSEAMSHPLQWELPGGKVEAGEGAKEALAREIREELAIDIEPGRELGSSVLALGDPRQPRRLLLQVFLCRWLRGEIRLVEHRAWRWVEASQLSTLSWSPADRLLLEDLRRHLETEV